MPPKFDFFFFFPRKLSLRVRGAEMSRCCAGSGTWGARETEPLLSARRAPRGLGSAAGQLGCSSACSVRAQLPAGPKEP